MRWPVYGDINLVTWVTRVVTSGGLHPAVLYCNHTVQHSRPRTVGLLPRQQTTNYLIQIAKREKKKTKLQKGIQTSDGEEYGYSYISLLTTTNKPSRIYARCVYCTETVCPASKVITTRKLYKSRRNIQYLNTLIEVKRFERCVGTQVQFVLEKNGQ
jgi:hypothetical protein